MQNFVADIGNALHQAAQFHRRRGRSYAETGIGCLTGGQVMGPGANATDVADSAGHLFHRAALAKFFKAAQGLDMQFGIGDIARVIQGDSYLGMAFDSRYWLNIDNFTHASRLLISPAAAAAPLGNHARRCNGSSWPVDPPGIWDPNLLRSRRPSFPPWAWPLCGWARSNPGTGSGPECSGAVRSCRRSRPGSPDPYRGTPAR